MSLRVINAVTKSPVRKVGMGGIDVHQGPGVLRTLLGSCIGLVLHDSKNRIGGMAHIVLPGSNGNVAEPGKFADTAIPALIESIQQFGGQTRHVVAKFAGGANMFATTSANAVGELNIAMVETLLNKAAIPVIARHCGGNRGRRVEFDIETGSMSIEIVGGVIEVI